MAQGQIYVQVDANAVNSGIMTMDASGGGHTEGSYWLHWDENGFQSKGWDLTHWDETPLKSWWATNHGEYSNDSSGLSQYLADNPNVNLDEALGNWTNKGEFVDKYCKDLGGRISQGGCIELL